MASSAAKSAPPKLDPATFEMIEKKTRDISELKWVFDLLDAKFRGSDDKAVKAVASDAIDVTETLLARVIKEDQVALERLYRAIAKRSRGAIPNFPGGTPKDNAEAVARSDLLAVMARSISLRPRHQRTALTHEYLERFCRLTALANAFMLTGSLFNAILGRVAASRRRRRGCCCRRRGSHRRRRRCRASRGDYPRVG
jgi:hypothetical protein